MNALMSPRWTMVEEKKARADSGSVRCALCGREYERAACRHQGCPLASHCQMLCCPHCGYRSVDEEASAMAAWLGRLLRRGREGGAA